MNSCANKRRGLGDEIFSDLSNIMLFMHKGKAGGGGGGFCLPLPWIRHCLL